MILLTRLLTFLRKLKPVNVIKQVFTVQPPCQPYLKNRVLQALGHCLTHKIQQGIPCFSVVLRSIPVSLEDIDI